MMNETMIMGEGMMMSPLVMLIFMFIFILPFWFIFAKAGFSKWLSLLMLVPGVNLLLLYYLAFANWPTKQ